jgi:hypothetical protein
MLLAALNSPSIKPNPKHHHQNINALTSPKLTKKSKKNKSIIAEIDQYRNQEK